MPRIFLIHGYVEDPTIFDQLVPLLPPANVVRINLAEDFARWLPTGPIDARKVAQYLTDHYRITVDDMLIGHSMGGWIAIHIKQLTGATTVQLASFTDQKKTTFPVRNLWTIRFILNSGLMQSRFLTDDARKKYRIKESADLYGRLVEGMVHMSRLYLWQQLQTLFAPVPALTVQPDLRIHARRDNIVRPPDEPFVEVPGDHFSLVYHAESVAEPIRTLLANLPTTAMA